MALFHCLVARVVGLLFRQLLMFLILLLLQLLPILSLLRDQFVLFLLVFLILFRISRGSACAPFDRRQILWMNRSVGTGAVCGLAGG